MPSSACSGDVLFVVPQEGHQSFRCVFARFVRREVVGDEHVSVLAGEVAEEGAHGLGEAVVRHIPTLQRPISRWYWLVLELQDFGQSALGFGPPRLLKVIGGAVEHENFLAVVAATPQAFGCFVLLLSVAGDLVEDGPKLDLLG